MVFPNGPEFSIRMWLQCIVPSMQVLSTEAPRLILIMVVSFRSQGVKTKDLQKRKCFCSQWMPQRRLRKAKARAPQTRKNLGCEMSNYGSSLSFIAQVAMMDSRTRSTKIKRTVAQKRNFLVATFRLITSQLLHFLLNQKEYTYLSLQSSHLMPASLTTASRSNGSSYFLAIHWLKHLVWMYCTLPVQQHGEISLLPSSQPLRQIRHSLGSGPEPRGRMVICLGLTRRIQVSWT